VAILPLIEQDQLKWLCYRYHMQRDKGLVLVISLQ